MIQSAVDEKLFWEPASQTRWGQYLSEIEARHILAAHDMAASVGDALEVGAEGGRWSRLLADRGWNMTCTDICEEALQVCQERIPDATCITVDVDAQELPVGDKSQDLILCIEVNEVLETDWFLAEVDRVLRPSGQLVGVFQNRHSLRGTFKTWFPKPGDTWQHYKVAFAPWVSKLQQRGLQVVKAEGMCWMPFGRTSNSVLVPLTTQIEQLMGLRRIVRYSPWITFIAQKYVVPTV